MLTTGYLRCDQKPRDTLRSAHTCTMTWPQRETNKNTNAGGMRGFGKVHTQEGEG